MNGTLVKEINDIVSNYVIIDRMGLSSGIYVYQLSSLRGVEVVGRVLVE